MTTQEKTKELIALLKENISEYGTMERRENDAKPKSGVWHFAWKEEYNSTADFYLDGRNTEIQAVTKTFSIIAEKFNK